MAPPQVSDPRPRSVLICHAESRLNREAIAPWLASFTNLVGMVIIEERPEHTRRRIRNEIRRTGLLRLADVMAFRLYYALTLARQDNAWMDEQLRAAGQRFGSVPEGVEIHRTDNPSSEKTAEFLRRLAPDFAIARCKRILHERVFSVPRFGTFVMHPGICPEYRNAHGAFWALAERDLDRVGLTLLRIDKGVDTGPVFGYFTYPFDENRESHIVIMTRLALDNLDAIGNKLLEICHGTAIPVDTTGRRSAIWGHPPLSRYLQWKRAAARRQDARSIARVP